MDDFSKVLALKCGKVFSQEDFEEIMNIYNDDIDEEHDDAYDEGFERGKEVTEQEMRDDIEFDEKLYELISGFKLNSLYDYMKMELILQNFDRIKMNYLESII